jgi:hypothetical protein
MERFTCNRCTRMTSTDNRCPDCRTCWGCCSCLWWITSEPLDVPMYRMAIQLGFDPATAITVARKTATRS